MPASHRTAPLLLVLGSIVSVQLGGAFAALLVHDIGPAPTVMLRLILASAVIVAVARPQVRGRSRAAWTSVAALGVALAVMNATFYGSLARLPIGVAVTVEFIGPLALSAVLSRRWTHGVAVATALVGVALISGAVTVPWSELDHLGLALAGSAGAAWAAYIVASRHVGRHFAEVDGLALSMVLAAVLVLPLGLVTVDPARISTGVLAAGLGVALLSSVLPYSLEMIALRHLDPRVFGVLLSLEPAMAALAGFLVLHQRLSPLQLTGMALVVAASTLVMGGAPEQSAAETPVAAEA